MRTTGLSILAIFIIAATFVSVSNAQGWRGRNFNNQNFRENLKAELKLTDAQQEKINSLRDAHQNKMIDLKAQMQKDALALRELKQNENVNRNDVLAAVEKLNKSREAMSLERTNHMLDVREVFTPEQRKLLKDKRGPFMGNGMGRMNGSRKHLFGRMHRNK